MGLSVRSLGRPQDRLAGCLLAPLAVIFAALFVVFVAFSTSQVQGDSMAPTLLPGDRLLVTQGYDTPLRGDVVVIMAERQGDSVDLVKRVVAVPGDRVEFEGNVVIVNGGPSLPRDAVLWPPTDDVGSLTVPEGAVFVLGDNRPVSRDSRSYGTVPLGDVAGRVMLVFTPVDRIGRVDGSPDRD